MSRFSNFMENRLMPVAGRIAEQRHLQAIRDGIILVIPLIIVGSLFLIISSLPIKGYPEFMANLFGESWQAKLSYPVKATFDIMGLVASFGVAYRLAERYKVDALAAGAISLASFLLLTPYHLSFTPEGAAEAVQVGNVIPVDLMGSKGLFVALIVGIISTEIFRWIVRKNWVIRMPSGVPPAVSRSFSALIPAFVVIIVIWVVRLLFELTSYESIFNFVMQVLQIPLEGLSDSLGAALIAVLLVQILWSIGIHGAAIVGGVMSPIWLSLMDQNRQAWEAGKDLPNVITSQFFDLWIYVGGSGATLGLVLMMLLWARSVQLKTIGRLAIGPGVFNINEPVTFGMPIVMNPLLIIPFILAPLVLTLITYLAMSTGLVPRPAGIAVPWTMPVIISGYLASGGKIMGAVLQVVNLIIGALIYYPFLRAWDKQKLAEENQYSNQQSKEGIGISV